MIDIKTMRAAGLNDGQILRVLELEQEERLARRREQNRINKQNQRSRQQMVADRADIADRGNISEQNQRLRQHVTADSADSADTPSSSPPSLSPSTPPPITTPTSPSPPRSLRSRGARLPSDWMPSDHDQQDALTIGLTRHGIQTEGEKFRDYWHARAGPGGAKCDWSATWRNWCRKAMERRNGAGNHKQSLSELAFEMADEIREREAAAGIGRPPDPVRSG